MAHTIISENYAPSIDATKATLAYGDRALPRLNRELNDSSLIVRQRSIMSLCDNLHDPEHIADALRVGIASSLKVLLADDNLTVRQKAAECLYIIAGHSIGRQAFLDHEIIVPLSILFDDSEDIARKKAHMAIAMLSETPPGAECIVEADLVEMLVSKLRNELDIIKDLILDTLHYCMQVDTSIALASGAMEVFTSLLSHNINSIRAKAARDIMDLSVPLAGKNRAVDCGAVDVLVKLLCDACREVRAKTAGALMTIAITTKGKYTAMNSGAIEPLLYLLDDPISEVRLNALKALTSLSEAPDGRKTLLCHLEKIKSLTHDGTPIVSKAADTAVRTISWKP